MFGFHKVNASKIKFSLVFVGLSFLMLSPVHAREQIQIVGSSTVFPFSTVVAERFGQLRGQRTPVVESTGTGGGFKLFCSGIGQANPDITNASRRIKKSEFEKCTKIGITIAEFQIGYDGIVFANARTAAKFELTRRRIFLALAARVPAPNRSCTAQVCTLIKNPYRSWNEIDPNLPKQRIEVLGPPPTSGTRDAFAELALEGGAKTFEYYRALKAKDKVAYKKAAHTLREDGAWIDVGENDNLMVSKLATNKNALGVFGFSFLDRNADKIKSASVDGIFPSFEIIESGEYKISRSLYVYVKREHIKAVKSIKKFMQLFTAEEMFGGDGYLVDKGLIPLPATYRRKMRRQASRMKALTLSDL